MSSKREQTRVQIMEAARRLLVERGYHGVGLEEVARAAGVSRQAVYLHFGSKAELLVALVRHQDESVGTPDILHRMQEAQTPVEALDRGVEAYATIEPHIYEGARLLDRARQADPAAEAAWQDRMAFRYQNMRERIAWLARDGLLADGWTVDEATDFMWALLSVHTYEYLVLERGWPIERLVDHLRVVLHRALVRGPDEAS